MPHAHFAASFTPPPTPGEVFTLVAPVHEDREVLVQEVPLALDPDDPSPTGSPEPVTSSTHLDTHPDLEGSGFQLPATAVTTHPASTPLQFTLAAEHGLHAVVEDPALVARVEVLVTPPHHRYET